MAFQGSDCCDKDSKALKVVAGKVSLCVAIRQGLVGPNRLGKPYHWLYWPVTINEKGNQVNIPELGLRKDA